MRITACEAVDPDRRLTVKEVIQSLRAEKQNEYADHIRAAYRGALITVDVQQSARRAATARPPRGSVAAFIVERSVFGGAAPLSPESRGTRVYFIPTRAPKPCATLPPGKVIVLYEQVACCDGDFNVPCLLGADMPGAPAPALPPSPSRPSTATDAGPTRR